MSASLVGSEMCIRDRLARTPPLPGCLELRDAGRCGFGQSEAVELGAPVSYTHLTLPTICSV
eukprot:4637330-Alexandrium_andersonii.AAC.1